MSANDNKIYYWFKLRKDFFDSHRIKIIENMPNGQLYIYFYLKLMCEATSHEGKLRYSENKPYTAEMLAAITNIDVDVVREALRLFNDFEMVQELEDGTLYLPEVEKNVGKETGQTIRKRENKPNIENEGKIYPDVTSHEGKNYPRDRVRDRDRDRNITPSIPPTADTRESDSSLSSSSTDTNTDTDTKTNAAPEPTTKSTTQEPEKEPDWNDTHFKTFLNAYPKYRCGNFTIGKIKKLFFAIEDIENEYPYIMAYIDGMTGDMQGRYLPRIDKFLTEKPFLDHERYYLIAKRRFKTVDEEHEQWLLEHGLIHDDSLKALDELSDKLGL